MIRRIMDWIFYSPHYDVWWAGMEARRKWFIFEQKFSVMIDYTKWNTAVSHFRHYEASRHPPQMRGFCSGPINSFIPPKEVFNLMSNGCYRATPEAAHLIDLAASPYYMALLKAYDLRHEGSKHGVP